MRYFGAEKDFLLVLQDASEEARPQLEADALALHRCAHGRVVIVPTHLFHFEKLQHPVNMQGESPRIGKSQQCFVGNPRVKILITTPEVLPELSLGRIPAQPQP